MGARLSVEQKARKGYYEAVNKCNKLPERTSYATADVEDCHPLKHRYGINLCHVEECISKRKESCAQWKVKYLAYNHQCLNRTRSVVFTGSEIIKDPIVENASEAQNHFKDNSDEKEYDTNGDNKTTTENTIGIPIPVNNDIHSETNENEDITKKRIGMPIPVKEEIHPYKFDYGINIEKSNAWGISISSEKHDVLPTRSRNVQFIVDSEHPYPLPSRTEIHHYKFDFGSNIKKTSTQHSSSDISNSLKSPLPKDLCPNKCRNVQFILDEEDPYPQPSKSEIHAYKFDFGVHIKKNNALVSKQSLTRVDILPRKRRNVYFVLEAEDKDPSPRQSEIHPYKLDFGTNLHKDNDDVKHEMILMDILPCQSRRVMFYECVEFLHPSVSELHPFKLDFGEHIIDKRSCYSIINWHHCYNQNYNMPSANVMLLTFSDHLDNIPSSLEEEDTTFEWKKPVYGKRVHFPIVKYRSHFHPITVKKNILKNLNDPNHVYVQDIQEKCLHISIVLASHMYWCLQELQTPERYDDEGFFIDLLKDDSGVQIQNDDMDEVLNMITGLEVLSFFNKSEYHPLKYARLSQYAGLLKEGCPAVDVSMRLNKTPKVMVGNSTWKERTAVSVGMVCEDEISLDSEEEEDDLCYGQIASTDDGCKIMEVYRKFEITNLHLECFDILRKLKLKHSYGMSTSDHLKVRSQVLLIDFDSLINKIHVRKYIAAHLKVDFVYDIKSVEYDETENTTTVTTLFQSRNKAQKFKFALNKLQKKTGCYAYLGNPSDCIHQKQYVTKMWAEVQKLIQDPFSEQQEKRERLQIELASKHSRKKLKLDQVDKALEEKIAIEQKLKELEKHKCEFTCFISALDKELHEIPNENSIEHIVDDMKSQFDKERERLRSALPMYAKRRDIIDMIANHHVSIVIGETGSGKSTQMTQYLYESGIAENGLICCTQPRKIAATTLAKRVSQEMHCKVGQLVGFKVGMNINVCRNTKIVYMTDHMLLKECIEDPLLKKYACIIIDEAHERSLYTDLLLGMIKTSLPKRPDLRVVITSATIDPEVFVTYFKDCPVLKVSGKVYPVDVIYSDTTISPGDQVEKLAVEQTTSIAELKEPGDILVFLPTPVETERAAERMERNWKGDKSKILCLALHGKTQPLDQQRIFDSTPKGKRKIVFATNSAETSITIPGIKFVVDTGLVKEKTYDPIRNVSALKVTYVSKSSANQRKGRAGRTASGKCYRLFTEEDYNKMEDSSKPEILRIHLGMALLQLLSLSIDDPLSFDFVEAPPKASLRRAYKSLVVLGAIENGQLTELGKKIAKLSIEPRLGKLVLRGVEEGFGKEAALVASFSAMGGNMFFRGNKEKQQQQADKLKVRFCHLRGDLHTMLVVYREWDVIPEKQKSTWCMENSINAKSMRMARDGLKEIIHTLTKELHLPVKMAYHRTHDLVDTELEKLVVESFSLNFCLYSGLDKLGYYNIYDTTQLLHIHPSSALKSLGKDPQYLVFENRLTTSRDFIVNITCISEETCESLSDDVKQRLQKVEEMVVYPCKIENISLSIMKRITGQRFSVMKQIEKDLQTYCDSELISIKTYFEEGYITAYSQKKYHAEIKRLLQDVIDRERAVMMLEEIERPLTEGSPVRTIIGPGGGIKHLLFADEFRALMIRGQYPSAEHVMETFREIGIVIDYQSKPLQSKGNPWVKVVFGNPEAAKESVQLVGEGYIDDMNITVKPDLTGAGGIAPPMPTELQIKLSWCRRPGKGFAFVKFKKGCPDWKNMACETASTVHSILIFGTHCSVSVSKKNAEELFIRNVPRRVSHDVVVAHIRERISDAMNINVRHIEAVAIRENIDVSNEIDIQKYSRNIIENMIEEEMDDHPKYRLHVQAPKEKTFDNMAFIYFEDPIAGKHFFEVLQGISILDNPVQVELCLKSTVHIRKVIFPYIKINLDKVMDELSVCRDGNVNFDVRDAHNSDITNIVIKANSFELLSKARTMVNEAVDGMLINVEDQKHLSHFTSIRGKRHVEKWEKKHHVLILVDNFKSLLAVFGTEQNTKKASICIDHHIKYLYELGMETISLKDAYPPGLIKLLMGKYGLELEKLADVTNLDYIELKLRSHTLYIQGKAQSFTATKQILSQLAHKLDEKAPIQNVDRNLPDCGVCLCPVEVGDYYQLEYCGHFNCKECTTGLLQNGIKDKDFPVRCPVEECRKEIVVKDFLAILGGSMQRLVPLIGAAIDHFVAKSAGTIKYCPTPRCSMVYKPTDHMSPQLCGVCSIIICTCCNSQFHEGISCEENKNWEGVNYDEYMKTEWIAEDTKNRALCPKCQSAIEKDGGCMHMECTNCKAHICWWCKEVFDNGSLTYTHIYKEHNSIFDYEFDD